LRVTSLLTEEVLLKLKKLKSGYLTEKLSQGNENEKSFILFKLLTKR
jgi:hypothetical protein